MARPRARRGVPRKGAAGAGPPASRLVPAAVTALAAVFAFRRLDDFDTWWHLAAGRWIALHRAVPATDVLSHTVRDHRWINLEWAYEVVVYALHAGGGTAALGLAATCAFAAAVWILLRLLRPHLGDVAGGLVGLVAVVVMQDRFAVRPEMISFPLLAGLLAILDSARRDGRLRPWLLVPLMVVWVNVHALFVIGVFAIGCGWISAPTRRLALWGLAAIASVLVNPFGLEGPLLPLKLFTLIDKSSPALQSIAEFRSPFAPDAAGIAMAAYKLLLVSGAASVLAACALNATRREGAGGLLRRIDFGDVLLFAGLAGLSMIARRNAALFALGASPIIARALGTVASRLPEAARTAWRRAAPAAAVATIAGCAVLSALIASGWYYRWDGQPREFGSGAIEGSFPIRAAAFAREAGLPGKLYNDLAAGGYLAWDDPIGDGVFIDGRLEVYDDAFVADYVAAMYDQTRWNADADRFGIQTVILFHRWENRRLLVQRLAADPAWSLVYADEVAVVFVRSRGNEAAIARADAIQERFNRETRAWLDRPIPRWRFLPGRVEGTRAFARLLATLGDDEGSAEQFLRLIALGIRREEEADIRLRLAKLYRNTGRAEQSRKELDRVLELAPDNAEARELLVR